jgi:hypothetical protein
LLEAIARFDDPALPIAEVSRRVGTEAARLGLFRPSYERVLDVALQLRPATAVLEHAAGEILPPLTRGP